MAEDSLERHPFSYQQDDSTRAAIRQRLQQAFDDLGL
jgi:hypothetical protein